MKIWIKIITGLLTLLGFSVVEIGCGRMEYGSPYADYEIKGKVTDSGNNPIEGIKIVHKSDWLSDGEIGTTITDSQGEYGFVHDHEWRISSTIIIEAEDTDGEENGGEFAPQTKEETIERSDYTGKKKKDEWYMGKVKKTIDFTLELKAENDDENKY